MGSIATVLFAVATVVAPSASALPPGHNPTTDAAVVAQLVFDTNLDGFMKGRSAMRRRHPHLDWTTDGCSAPVVGSSGRSFNFRSACIRHDFAYRNAKRLPGEWRAPLRRKIDEQFRRDMVASCAARPMDQKVSCRSWAEIFVRAVRIAGGP